MLAVLNTWHDLSLRRAVALEFVRDNHAGYVLQALQQLTEEPLGGFLVPLTLHQDIQDVAILVHGSPQIMNLAIDLDEHLIEVPLVARTRTSTAQFISEGLTELSAPFTDRFIGERHATHSHDLFDISVAESEAEVKPHCVAECDPFL